MTFEELSQSLHHVVLECRNALCDCVPEEGILFLLPPPAEPKRGTVFAGSVSDWKVACTSGMVYDGCTYLICREGEMPKDLPSTDRRVNLLFLDTSVQAAVQFLADILSGKSAVQQPVMVQMYQNFWKDIMFMRMTDSAEIGLRMKEFPFPVHTYIACIILRHSYPQHNGRMLEIQQALEEFFPDTNLFFDGKEWIVLYSQEQEAYDILDISYGDFSELLVHFGMEAGVSYVSRFPEMLRTLYLTAAASIDLGNGLEIPPSLKRLYTYRQYNAYYVIHLCAQNYVETHNTDNFLYLTHPDIIRLYYYDRENNNNLLEVLFTYLSCEKNVKHTARILYVHRNTVLNKLNKIESVLSHNLDYDSDHFLLLLSCMIMKYQHTYTKRDVNDFFDTSVPEGGFDK